MFSDSRHQRTNPPYKSQTEKPLLSATNCLTKVFTSFDAVRNVNRDDIGLPGDNKSYFRYIPFLVLKKVEERTGSVLRRVRFFENYVYVRYGRKNSGTIPPIAIAHTFCAFEMVPEPLIRLV